MDTGQTLNVYEMLKGDSGRLLNVLCIVDLNPVTK